MPATFTWCPAPGVTQTTAPRLYEAKYGDGYTHRLTTGLNPLQQTWNAVFPGTRAALAEIEIFLQDNGVPGFYWAFFGPDILVTCDEWTVTVNDRTRGGELIGTLAATFRRSWNLQP
jgi:phage-related protein